MKTSLVRAIAGALAIMALTPAPFVPHQSRAYAQTAPVFTGEQLDQMLAPIALYPDPLLAEVLMAATYPLEVVAAARWLQDPRNAGLTGDALANAAESQDWDPSVISLVSFPQVIQMMNSRLDWMQAVGDAFLGQQPDVMDSVQRLRRAAQAAGTLAPSAQANVVVDGQTIEIEPGSDGTVYVPCYNPAYVYGAWPYANYPPVYFSPWSGCAVGQALAYGAAIAVVRAFWGWDSWDWRGHRINIDRDRYNRIDRDRRPFNGTTWQHDPYHRRGVAYRDPGTRTRYGNAPQTSPSRAARGYPSGAPAVTPPAVSAPSRPPSAPPFVSHPASPPSAPSAAPSVSRPGSPPSAPSGGPSVSRPASPPSAPSGGPSVSRPASPPQAAPARTAPSAPAVQRPSAPAFSGIGNGNNARSEAARGQSSMPSAPSRPAAAAPRAAPSQPSGAPPRPGNPPAGAPQPPGNLPHP
ncbi:MAG: DUF3300 domain-containing protein [Alphaproteobacteria bacterium]